MPNIGKVISNQNSKNSSQKGEPDPTPAAGVGGGPGKLPLGGGCEVKEVYGAEVTRLNINTSETYTGLTGGSFKVRYYKRQIDFRREKNEPSTCLSKHIWNLKSEMVPYR